MTRLRCAIPDDYFELALCWRLVQNPDRVDITVFKEAVRMRRRRPPALKDFEIISGMRERTASRAAVSAAEAEAPDHLGHAQRLDRSGAAKGAHRLLRHANTRDPTAPLTMGLILELTRGIGRENARMHAGEPWQTFAGIEIEGKTLGVVGLGKLGSKVARIARRSA
jgi:D-3-phosphoglycerate dehydrogenase